MDMPADLDALSTEQIRELNAKLMAEISEKESCSTGKQHIDQLTHELSVIKRQQFDRRSEQLNKEQLSLLEEALDADLTAIWPEQQGLKSGERAGTPRQQPKRPPLPPELPSTDIYHEPDSTICTGGCERVRIGEDISEKLDCTPGVFTVERHIRGKWACKACETPVQAAVPPHVIDNGIPTTDLLAQVLVAKYNDYLQLYRQERIFARAGLAIAQSTLGA